jgi:hypothetical protein
VPEAAIHEHRYSAADEDDIGADAEAWNDQLVIDAETQAVPMEKRAQLQLRAGVALAICAHGSRDGSR